jgi:hypothetical protein
MRMDHLRVRMRSLSSTSTVPKWWRQRALGGVTALGSAPGTLHHLCLHHRRKMVARMVWETKGPRCRDPGWGDDAVLLVQRVCWDRWLPELKSGAVMRDELRSRQAHA